MTRICVTPQQVRKIHDRLGEVVRRVMEGSITFEPTMDALQSIIEGKHEPERKSKKPRMQICQAFDGCRCTICGGYFGDGDDICQNGHMIGQTYPVLR